MFYVRAREHRIREDRGGGGGGSGGYLGPLSNAEAETVVFSTFCFRQFNRLGTSFCDDVCYLIMYSRTAHSVLLHEHVHILMRCNILALSTQVRL